jgi:hypothetical protein
VQERARHDLGNEMRLHCCNRSSRRLIQLCATRVSGSIRARDDPDDEMRLEQAEETDRQKEKDRGSVADCIQAKKARYEAAIPSKPKPSLQQEEQQVQERD